MQFLWLWIDDLIGKGLEASIIAELIFNQSTTLIPLALPISMLLSSIMTFGSLGQHYELVAMKAAGVPLRKIMMPIFIFGIFLTLAAFYIINITVPNAFMKSRALLYDVSEKKPTFNIREGIFYNGIDGYSIKVSKKDPDNETINDVMIYDHTSNRGFVGLIMAEKGRMTLDSSRSNLLVTLYNGKRYEEIETAPGENNYPHDVMHFAKQEMLFDLSSFELNRSSQDLFRDNYQMLNVTELTAATDSLKRVENRKRQESAATLHGYFAFLDSRQRIIKNPYILKNNNVLHGLKKDERQRILGLALNNARAVHGIVQFAAADQKNSREYRHRFDIEWHKKFTLSLACLIFFFIGAPFGSIIRKGGFGLPMVVSIVIFVVYYMFGIGGEKASKETVLSPVAGVWLANLVMIPFGIFLTYKASIDSGLFNAEIYYKLLSRFSRKKTDDSIIQ